MGCVPAGVGAPGAVPEGAVLGRDAGDPDPGIELMSPVSPAFQADSLPAEP